MEANDGENRLSRRQSVRDISILAVCHLGALASIHRVNFARIGVKPTLF